MPDSEQHEQQAQQDGTPEAAAPDTPTGVPSQTPAGGEADDDSPTVTFSQKKLDSMFGKVREEERRKTQELEQRLQRMEAERTQYQASTQTPPVTVETVLTAYERGQITETQKDQWLLHFAKESAKQEFGQTVGMAAQMMKAQGVVEQYAKAKPAVNDTSTQEFAELKTTYQELLAEGYPANVTTQAKALRMTFGPLKTHDATVKEHTRQRADTFLEGAGGGGSMTHERDPLKDVPERVQQHWKKQGYTKAQMIEEAKMRGVGNIDDFRKMKVTAR